MDYIIILFILYIVVITTTVVIIYIKDSRKHKELLKEISYNTLNIKKNTYKK